MITNKKIPALCAKILETEARGMCWTAGSDGTFKVGRSGMTGVDNESTKLGLALAMARALGLHLSLVVGVSPAPLLSNNTIWRSSVTVYGSGVLSEIFVHESSDLLTPVVLFTSVLNDAQAQMVSKGLYAIKRRKANAE